MTRLKSWEPNVPALAKLADFIDTIPPDNFHFASWDASEDADGDFESAPVPANKAKFTGNFQCGFAGCAIGWAAHAKIIPGLRFSRSGVVTYKRRGATTSGWYAVEVAFHLDNSTSAYFFAPRSYLNLELTKPAEVAARIRDWIAALK